MPEIGTSGLMSGDGKRGGDQRQYPRPSSTLPAAAFLGGSFQGRLVHSFPVTTLDSTWNFL